MSGNDSNKRISYFKYNQDDILEILTEYLAKENGYGTFYSKAVVLGTPGEDLRFLVAVGTLDDDECVEEVDFEHIDKTLDYNGSHN